MKFTIVGLGNPGEEYMHTRHNAGRLVVEAFEHMIGFGGFQEDKKSKSLVAKGSVGKHTATLVLPETFMNKSGSAVVTFIPSVKAAERLIVVYDDIDLPFGQLRISYGRGSGGHKGIESIVRSLKTKDFVRIRVGVAPTTPSGKIKKPQGEQKVHDFLLGEFTKKEQESLKSILKKTTAATETIIDQGRVPAMNQFN